MNGINSYSIYREYVELLEILKEKEAKDLLWKITKYIFYDEEPKNLSKDQLRIWNNLKRPIDKSKTKSKSRTKQNQNEIKIETKDNDIKDVDVSSNNSNIITTNVNVYVNSNNIFELLENVFGRTLSSSEIEIINTWEDNELTRYAIKQAELNRVFKVKYIQGILNNYKDNGIKTVQDAEEHDKNFKNKKSKSIEPTWLNQKQNDETLTPEEEKELKGLLGEFK